MKAVITAKKLSLTATLDPAVISQAKMNLYELAQANGYQGSFDEFLAEFRLEVNNLGTLISTDNGNTLTLGSDNKLYVNPFSKQDW